MTIVYIILCIIAFLFVFTAMSSSLIYWYETLNSPCAAVPSPRPGILPCLRVFFVSLSGYLLGVSVHPIGWFWRKKPVASGEPHRIPLILVHGINDNAAVWLYLASKLEKAGYAVSTFSYFSLFVSMDAISARLDAHIRAIEDTFPGQKPILIGHSLGGIFIRRWLLEPANAQRARAVLTLGTPHGGSKMAALAPGKLGKNILPTAELIATLKDAPSVQIPCVSFVSPTDEAVLPAASLLPPQDWKLIVTHRVSHFGMLYCPRAARLLLAELDALA